MNQINLRKITNHFQDVRLASLSSWKQANEFTPRDRGGPYVVIQEGYDPEDPKMLAHEFVLGRSGQWVLLALFYRMPVPERRAEYIFGTAAEVMQLLNNLPSRVSIMRPGEQESDAEATPPEGDDMAAALQAGKGHPPDPSK